MKIKTIEREFKRIINKNKAHNYTQFNKINIFTAKGKGVFQMRKNAMIQFFLSFFYDLNNHSKLGKSDINLDDPNPKQPMEINHAIFSI